MADLTSNSKLMATLNNNEYIIAARHPRYRSLDIPKRQATLATYIAEVYKFRGQVANSKDLVVMARDLDRKIAGDENLSCLTIEEVRVSFLHGVTGEYGEYFGINYVTLTNWINSYFFAEERLDVIKKLQYAQVVEARSNNAKALAQKSSRTTAMEAEQVIIDNIKEYFNDVKQGEPINAMLQSQAAAYQYLTAKGVLVATKEEKASAFGRATDWLKRYRETKERTIMEILDDSCDRSGGDTITDRDRIIRKAKSIVLASWLKKQPSLSFLDEVKPL